MVVIDTSYTLVFRCTPVNVGISIDADFDRNFYNSYSATKAQELGELLLDRTQERHPYNIQWTTEQIEKAYKQILN